MNSSISKFKTVFILIFVLNASAQGAFNCQYIMEKVVEATRNPQIIFSQKNLKLMAFVTSLMLTTKERAFVRVPLHALNTIHTIDAPEAQHKMAGRAEMLVTHFDEIVDAGILSVELQNKLIPSIYPLMAVQDKFGNFVVFDGNGRLGAIHKAFQGRLPDLPVEVQVFDNKGAFLPNYLVHKVMLAHGFKIPRLESQVPFVEISRESVGRMSLIGEMTGLFHWPFDKKKVTKPQELEK